MGDVAVDPAAGRVAEALAHGGLGPAHRVRGPVLSRFARTPVCRLVVFPTVLYLAIFALLQPRLWGKFSTAFFLDDGDGYQNVWNFWWVNHALTVLHTNPYYTHLLQAPRGTTLVPQTMNIFNGLVGVPLQHVFGLTLIEAVNVMVVFSFVAGGATMFLLLRDFVGDSNYAAALVGGGLYTFSSYHFAHAQGHMQLVSLEWIPLFVMLFWRLLNTPMLRYALGAAVALFLVMLCDYYYMTWSVVLGGLWFVWTVGSRKLVVARRALIAYSVFIAGVLVLCGPLMLQLYALSKPGVLGGQHPASFFKLDPLELIVPGATWSGASLTEWYWSNSFIPGFSESSIYIALPMLVVLTVVLVQQLRLARRPDRYPSWLWFWWIVAALFGLFAIGPRLSVFGHTLDAVPMPYSLAVRMVPSLDVSGLPLRWAFVSYFAFVVITTVGLARLRLSSIRWLVVFALFVAASLVAMYPRAMPTTVPRAQDLGYLHALKSLPDGVVYDAAATTTTQLYNQTVHGHPMIFGYISRTPTSLTPQNDALQRALAADDYAGLCSLGLRYITARSEHPLNTTFPTVYRDHVAIIYDLKNSAAC